MKLTIEHFPFREKFGEEKAFEMLSSVGFDGVDYSFNNTGKGAAIDLEKHVESAKRTRKLLDKYGLVANQAHAPFAFQFGEAMDESNKNYKDMIRTIESCSIIGIKILVVHAVKVPKGGDFFTYNYRYYKSLQPYAEKFGVKIAVENLVNSIFWLPEKLSKFIEELDSPVFCACVDVGHSAITGTEPEHYIAGMEKKLIECIHMHDTDGKLDRHWIPYQGEHNWENILKALAEYGFNGDMNLEIIHSFDNLPTELYLPMLTYIAKVGRFLIDKFDEYKNI